MQSRPASELAIRQAFLFARCLVTKGAAVGKARDQTDGLTEHLNYQATAGGL